MGLCCPLSCNYWEDVHTVWILMAASVTRCTLPLPKVAFWVQIMWPLWGPLRFMNRSTMIWDSIKLVTISQSLLIYQYNLLAYIDESFIHSRVLWYECHVSVSVTLVNQSYMYRILQSNYFDDNCKSQLLSAFYSLGILFAMGPHLKLFMGRDWDLSVPPSKCWTQNLLAL